MSWIQTVPSGPFGTNAYLISTDDSDQAVLIDAPPDCHSSVGASLTAATKHLTGLLVTHSHFDHILDVRHYVEDGIPVYAHAKSVAGIQTPQTLGLIPDNGGGLHGGRVDVIVKGGETMNLAGMMFEIFDVPGHSADSLAYYVRDMGVCFVGDVIFQGSIGRTDLPGGDFDTLAESIQKIIYTLPDDTILFPGHGPETTVGEEKRSNPFVRG